MKKRVLIISPSDKLGGAEQFLLNIAKYYISVGYVVDVYFLLRKSNDLWNVGENINLYYTSASRESIGSLSLIIKLLKNKCLYNITYSSHQHVNALLSQLRFLRIIKTDFLITRESTSVFIRFKKSQLYFYKFLYSLYSNKSINLIICQTEEMKKQLLDNCEKFKSYNVNVIKNPIDLTTAKFESTKIVEYSDYILAIGRLHPVKKFDKLISAYYKSPILRKRKLLILGEGNERLYLEKLIKQYGLTNQVFLIGQVSNVYKYIAKAQVCAVTSEREGFPNVLLQMYSLNRKVVITPCCGGLEDFPNLYITKDHSIESIKVALESAIKDDTAYNFKSFIEKYDIKNFIRQVNKSLKI